MTTCSRSPAWKLWAQADSQSWCWVGVGQWAASSVPLTLQRVELARIANDTDAERCSGRHQSIEGRAARRSWGDSRPALVRIRSAADEQRDAAESGSRPRRPAPGSSARAARRAPAGPSSRDRPSRRTLTTLSRPSVDAQREQPVGADVEDADERERRQRAASRRASRRGPRTASASVTTSTTVVARASSRPHRTSWSLARSIPTKPTPISAAAARANTTPSRRIATPVRPRAGGQEAAGDRRDHARALHPAGPVAAGHAHGDRDDRRQRGQRRDDAHRPDRQRLVQAQHAQAGARTRPGSRAARPRRPGRRARLASSTRSRPEQARPSG